MKSDRAGMLIAECNNNAYGMSYAKTLNDKEKFLENMREVLSALNLVIQEGVDELKSEDKKIHDAFIDILRDSVNRLSKLNFPDGVKDAGKILSALHRLAFCC